MVTMKNQGRLMESGKRLKFAGIVHELKTERDLPLLAIVENRRGTALLPFGKTLWAELFDPELMKSKSRSQQYETIDLGMASGIQGGQIPAETGADQDDRFVASQSFHQFQLPANCKMLKVSLCQIRHCNGNVEIPKLAREEPRLT